MAIAVNEMYEYGGFWSPYDSRHGRGILGRMTVVSRAKFDHKNAVLGIAISIIE